MELGNFAKILMISLAGMTSSCGFFQRSDSFTVLGKWRYGDGSENPDPIDSFLFPVLVSSSNSSYRVQTGFASNGTSQHASFDSIGRFVVFRSNATNLINGVGGDQIYLKDMHDLAAPPMLVSSRDSNAGDGMSTNPHISRNGRFVVFSSQSTNLVNISSGAFQIYLKDMNAPDDPPKIVSSRDSTATNQNGEAGNVNSSRAKVSDNGRYVVFRSSATNFGNGLLDAQIYRKDMNSPALPPTIVSSRDSTMTDQGSLPFRGNASSASPSMSADGLLIVFNSNSTNFVTGANGSEQQVYLKDMSRPNEPPILVSSIDSEDLDQGPRKGNAGSSAPWISGDGRYVVFVSNASNFVTGGTGQQIYLKDLDALTAAPILVSSLDSNKSDQEYDRGNGLSSNPYISYDGRYILFTSNSTNFVTGASGSKQQVYLKDMSRPDEPPILVSTSNMLEDNQTDYAGNNDSFGLQVSDDGQLFLFLSNSTNFVEGANGIQIYMREKQ
jgi:hypothetical protein